MELSWRSTVSSAVDIGYPTPRVWPLGDVALLLLIIIAPVLTGRTIGLFTDSASGIVAMNIATCGRQPPGPNLSNVWIER